MEQFCGGILAIFLFAIMLMGVFLPLNLLAEKKSCEKQNNVYACKLVYVPRSNLKSIEYERNNKD